MFKIIALLCLILTCFNSAQSMEYFTQEEYQARQSFCGQTYYPQGAPMGYFSNQIPIVPALPMYSPSYFPQGNLLPMHSGQQQVLTYVGQSFDSYNPYANYQCSMQTTPYYMPRVPTFTYMYYYEGQWQESFHNLQYYYDPSLNVNSLDFGIHHASPEESMRLNIAYGAYRKTIEIAECIQSLNNKAISHNYLAQLKGIVFQILSLTQIENCLWNEYVIYNGIRSDNAVLGNEWVKTIFSQQNLLTNELGQFKHSKGKKKGHYYRKIREIWQQYKKNNRTLEKLNNDAISRIMLQIEQFPVLGENPLIKHELLYREKYQIYKSWMIFAERHESTSSKH